MSNFFLQATVNKIFDKQLKDSRKTKEDQNF